VLLHANDELLDIVVMATDVVLTMVHRNMWSS